MDIYYQPQSGGLCRMHSLNAYFGKDKISVHQFSIYQKEYDNIYAKKFNFSSSCKEFDIVASDQKNIVSFILKQYQVYSRYFAINELFRKDIDIIISILKGDFIFIYDDKHIWGARRLVINNQSKWYTVDSIGGIRPLNITSLISKKNIGFIVPVDIRKEFYVNLKLIKDILGGDITLESIKKYLLQKHKECEILGDLEIPLSICMDIWETQLEIKSLETTGKKNNFDKIQNIVYIYNEFISKFTDGRYNDIEMILKYIPDVIYCITSLNCSC